jgi:hypothetical protein
MDPLPTSCPNYCVANAFRPTAGEGEFSPLSLPKQTAARQSADGQRCEFGVEALLWKLLLFLLLKSQNTAADDRRAVLAAVIQRGCREVGGLCHQQKPIPFSRLVFCF